MQTFRPYTTKSLFRKARAARPRRGDWRFIKRIRKAAERLTTLSDQQLTDASIELRDQMRQSTQPHADPRFVESFAMVTEAVRRALGKTYYDVQLLAGLILASGSVAEMQTGEGKTITAALPAYWGALADQGVHVATTNDYLAGRDFEQLTPVFRLLGMSTGLVLADMSPKQKQAAYACDVTYGPGYEFGFDFLRDRLSLLKRPKLSLGTAHLARLMETTIPGSSMLQPSQAFAIVDEADSVLVDEATTPLILSGPVSEKAEDPAVYRSAANTSNRLELERDFHRGDDGRSISLTPEGWTRIHTESALPRSIKLKRPWAAYVTNALHAKHVLHRDVDYVVRKGAVEIVDQNTGRIHPERTWRAGLHQAVEVCEHLEATSETASQARVSRQRYFQQYPKLAGTTGTAQTCEGELAEFYEMAVVVVPTNRPCIRQEHPARYFPCRDAKLRAMADDISNHTQGVRPILVGTRTIRDSRRLSELLTETEIEHTVLNGLQDEKEAKIIERAGRASSVTIATNIAGRGTDIVLDPEALEAGGLHVMAAEHHRSRRVDRQLIGRAARQGDPGSYQFFVAEDDEIFASDSKSLGKRIHQQTSAEIEQTQRRLENEAFDARRRMVQSDHWVESVLETMARRA